MEGSAIPTQQEEQRSLVTAGQRKVNLIWERTQSFVAILVIVANLFVAVMVSMANIGIIAVKSGPPAEMPPVLTNAMFLIVGFYFSRTNHTAIGGEGAKPSQPYEGR